MHSIFEVVEDIGIELEALPNCTQIKPACNIDWSILGMVMVQSTSFQNVLDFGIWRWKLAATHRASAIGPQRYALTRV